MPPSRLPGDGFSLTGWPASRKWRLKPSSSPTAWSKTARVAQRSSSGPSAPNVSGISVSTAAPPPALTRSLTTPTSGLAVRPEYAIGTTALEADAERRERDTGPLSPLSLGRQLPEERLADGQLVVHLLRHQKPDPRWVDLPELLTEGGHGVVLATEPHHQHTGGIRVGNHGGQGIPGPLVVFAQLGAAMRVAKHRHPVHPWRRRPQPRRQLLGDAVDAADRGQSTARSGSRPGRRPAGTPRSRVRAGGPGAAPGATGGRRKLRRRPVQWRGFARAPSPRRIGRGPADGAAVLDHRLPGCDRTERQLVSGRDVDRYRDPPAADLHPGPGRHGRQGHRHVVGGVDIWSSLGAAAGRGWSVSRALRAYRRPGHRPDREPPPGEGPGWPAGPFPRARRRRESARHRRHR